MSNIDFYNEIAGNYDTIMDNENSNEIVRKKVEEKFTSIVEKGWVLDFGGGTGSDLNWLVANNYNIVFCEPSAEMRKKAIDRYKNESSADKIIFLENDKVDFTNWGNDIFFPEKVKAVLADFAVFNCIADIDLLFKKLAHVVKPGGYLFALILKPGYQKSWIWKVREFVRNLITNRAQVLNVKYKDHLQTVYIYSPKRIEGASSKYFNLHSKEDLYGFSFYTFVRDEH